LENILSWMGPACILTGSLLAAANAGAKWTGCGFIFLTLGAVCFGAVSISAGDLFGSIVNGGLVLINGFGVRRWLGHLAAAEAAASNAQLKSEASGEVPTVTAVSKVIGRKVKDKHGNKFGEVADVMVEVESGKFGYFVIHPAASQVGSGFVGIQPNGLDADAESFVMNCSTHECVLLADGDWPSHLRSAA
jgi:hypothetical protein